MSPGTPPPPPPPPPPHPSFDPSQRGAMGEVKTSAAALWSLILGGLSVVCCCVSGLPGVILGVVGLVNIGKSQGRLKGKGLAIAGIILSCLLPVVPSALLWSVQTTSNPQLRKIFGGFGDVFDVTQQLTKATAQATAIAGGLQAYADGHNGELPATLEALVSEGLIESGEIDPPSASLGPVFWQLTEPGKVLADLDPKAMVVKGGPVTLMGQELYVVIRADGTVERLETAQVK